MAHQEVPATTRTGLCHPTMDMEEAVEVRSHLWLLRRHGQVASPSSAVQHMVVGMQDQWACLEVLLLSGGGEDGVCFKILYCFESGMLWMSMAGYGVVGAALSFGCPPLSTWWD